jgi:hypothetical protein
MKNTETTKSNGTVKNLSAACVASCRKLVAQIAEAKENLLAEFRHTFSAPERLIRLALNEAEAAAWETDFPQLFFPTLAQEKIQAVATWSAHQQTIRGSRAQLAA